MFSFCAGDLVTYDNRADVEFIYRTANLYRANVLHTAALLQDMNVTPFDINNDAHWPPYEDLF